MKEIWKDIQGYEGLYQVSNLGFVKNLKRNRLLGGTIERQGYVRIGLRKDGQTKMFLLHRLVAEAFIPNPNNLPIVDHIIQLSAGGSNSIDNLRWASFSDNAYNRNTGELKYVDRRKKNKLLQLDAQTGAVINTYSSITEASKETGISQASISLCSRGIAQKGRKNPQKHAGGFEWRWE